MQLRRFRRSGGAALALFALTAPTALTAQAPAAPSPPQAPRPAVAAPAAPDRLVIFKLVWSAMLAVDQADRSGNYSVLRDLGSAGFQARNNAATLAGTFAGLRAQQIDLSDTLLVEPRFDFPPAMVAPNILRVRGTFPLRPRPIGFDLIFQSDAGWRLDAIAIMPAQAAAVK